MKQILIYLVMAAALLGAILGWQVFNNTGQGALILQKFADINDLPSDFKELVSKKVHDLPQIGPDARLEFGPTPDEIMPKTRSTNPILKDMEETRNVRWLGKFTITRDNVPEEWFYVIENEQVVRLAPAEKKISQ